MYSFRNSLMKITVFIEFGALTCGLGMMIGGFFGMNLHSGLEDSNYAFIVTVGCTCALMLTVFGWLLLVCWIEIRYSTVDMLDILYIHCLLQTYRRLHNDTTSANNFNLLKSFFTNLNDFEYHSSSKHMT